jgi:hypothetical protein
MMLAAALASVAIVTQDASALRAAPSDGAAQQAQLWQGDLLEVRGRRGDHLQVWDHRRERGGYVRATQVRTVALQPQDAPDLLAVVRFLRDNARRRGPRHRLRRGLPEGGTGEHDRRRAVRRVRHDGRTAGPTSVAAAGGRDRGRAPGRRAPVRRALREL